MKTLISMTVATCVLVLAANPADGREYNSKLNYSFALNWPWSSHSLEKEVNHLNRMRGHVRWQFRNYKSTPEQRRNYFAISRDIDGINARFKQSGSKEKRQLRRDVEHAHTELHRIELALKVKPRDYYSWR